MSQPPLTHHYVAWHLGGAKRVTRCGEGATLVRDAAARSLTMVPAGAIYDWTTEGMIDFAHVYIDPARLARTVGEVFDRDPATFSLTDQVAVDDPLLAAAFDAILEGAELVSHPIYLETVFETVLARLVATHGNLGTVHARRQYTISPSRLRAVRDFIAARFVGEISLDDLAQVAGLSRFHFVRAFHSAEGVPPYAYLTRYRLAEAKRLLRETDLRIGEIACACGYSGAGQLTSAFRRRYGVSPSVYRSDR